MNLESSIKKSLFDRNIESFAYNPNIVINENTKNIKDKLESLLKTSERVDIAVSYVVWSGLSLIFDKLKHFGSDSRLILTTEGMVTDISSLKKLNELNMQVKVYVPATGSKGFHLKTYLFENNNNRTILIGSFNISARAFGLVHEMAVEIDANEQGYIVDQYNSIFNELWKDPCSEFLTSSFIEGYENLYKLKKDQDKMFNDFLLSTNQLEPNYMQEQALKELEECRLTNNRGLVIAATGTGKTYLSAFDVRNANAKKVLFLVHNRLILTSAVDTFKKVFRGKKIIELNSSNRSEIDSADFIFTTDKTAANIFIDNYPKDTFDYIIYDEAHKIGLDTKYDSLISYFTPKFTLGITATPERTDNAEFLFDIFNYIVPYEIRLLDAMDHELICPFTYYGLNLQDSLLKNNETFEYDQLSKYIKSLVFNKGHYGEKLRCIIFCSNIKEATELSEALNNNGFISKSATSNNKLLTREMIESYIKSLKSDKKDSVEIICVVNKFNEGIDIPEINTIIMLRNTTSSIIYLQQLGRGLRKTTDPHKYVTVFDIIGNSKNNYSIAEVLTGNRTVDKRKLFKHANNEFKSVSPFINVEMEKEAMEKVIKSISNNFTVKTRLNQKFKDELYRFKEIPTLLELYTNPNFNELDLFQLLFKNYYEPFQKYYYEKYNISLDNKFISGLLTLLTQFVFRSYDKDTLKDYIRILKGELVSNDLLRRILMPADFDDGISSAINSNYYKKGKNFPKVFIYENKAIKIRKEIFELIKTENAEKLFLEHIELFEYLVNNKSTKMKDFDLIDKGEFLFNTNSNDCYMNVVGERIDHTSKKVFCAIKITKKDSHYDNYVYDNNKIVYYTQSSQSEEKAIEKINKLVEENYEFHICAQFPHLGYTSSSYFNLGNVKIFKVSEVKKAKNDKFNHEIIFELEKNIPLEFMEYERIVLG